MTTSAAELAISARGLRKTYHNRRGRHVAVQGLDLDVPLGGVHGFLGPNGSGKTTTIRMLLGLVRADSGTMSIFGHKVPEHLPEVVGQVGAIVESPRFFPAFSGRRNLQLLAEAIGRPRATVDQVLEQTSLGERGGDRYSTYSPGMKQGLAIAATMLKEPDLLIFDEPTNGLDPAGTHEIRNTMRSLGEQGKTVLVSSHLLDEVRQVADTVSVIGHGRLLASGRVAEVIGDQSALSIRVGVADLTAAAGILTDCGLVVRLDGGLLVVEGVSDGAEITRRLAAHDLFVSELTPVRADLKSVFLELTADEGLENAGTAR